MTWREWILLLVLALLLVPLFWRSKRRKPVAQVEDLPTTEITWHAERSVFDDPAQSHIHDQS